MILYGNMNLQEGIKTLEMVKSWIILYKMIKNNSKKAIKNIKGRYCNS